MTHELKYSIPIGGWNSRIFGGGYLESFAFGGTSAMEVDQSEYNKWKKARSVYVETMMGMEKDNSQPDIVDNDNNNIFDETFDKPKNVLVQLPKIPFSLYEATGTSSAAYAYSLDQFVDSLSPKKKYWVK